MSSSSSDMVVAASSSPSQPPPQQPSTSPVPPPQAMDDLPPLEAAPALVPFTPATHAADGVAISDSEDDDDEEEGDEIDVGALGSGEAGGVAEDADPFAAMYNKKQTKSKGEEEDGVAKAKFPIIQ